MLIRRTGCAPGFSSEADGMSVWKRAIRQPQSLWLRRAMFQVHLWAGVGVGLYLFLISLTGSVLVYRNEMFQAVTPVPIITTVAGDALTDDQLREAAAALYPGFKVTNVLRARNPRQAVDVWLVRDKSEKHRLFDPITGRDLGDTVPFGVSFVSGLIDLHDNLFGGPTGRQVNGAGALFLVVLCLTGAVIWWPGLTKWRGSIWPNWKANWKRINWSLHSALGFWLFAFVLMWGVTGVYLSFQATLNDWVDLIEPVTPENAGSRWVDSLMFWLTFLHFGRFGGRFRGCGSTCNATFKAIWCVAGITPAVMFVTGAIIWWNRVLGKAWRASPSGATQRVG
jgi:uncharacterized iron-regulated membrane protein